MNREEILRASREENKNQDLAEMDIVKTAGRHGAGVGALVSCLLSVLAYAIVNEVIYSPWVIYFSITCTQWVTRFVKARHKSDLVVAILLGALALMSLGGFVYRLVLVGRGAGSGA